MKLHSRSPILLAACSILASGCGPEPAPPTVTGAAAAGPNRRYQMKEEYKQVLGKDGQLLWKPGMPMPRPAAASIPKP